MIRKLKSGHYRLYSRKMDPKTGKRRNLGTFATRKSRAARAPCSSSSTALRGNPFACRDGGGYRVGWRDFPAGTGPFPVEVGVADKKNQEGISQFTFFATVMLIFASMGMLLDAAGSPKIAGIAISSGST